VEPQHLNIPSEPRRAALTILLAALVLQAPVCSAIAQPVAAKPFRIGWLTGSSSASYVEFLNVFRDGLVELGWTEGRQFVLLPRYADGRLERLEQLATELVGQNVDLIVATTPPTLVAARMATSHIPIVMVYGPDPAEVGVVASLSRPGGNVTGLTSLSVDLSVKQLELLRAILPRDTRVGVLWNPSNPWHAAALERIGAAEAVVANRTTAVPVHVPDDIEKAFAAMTKQRIGGLLCLSDPMTFSHRVRMAELAVKYRLPTMHGVTAYADSGGLAAYWPNPTAMHRRAATYSYRILSGARPADLPIEQPTRFEFVVNLRTAKALGISVPANVLARADRVIE
jgi:putative ABC transport system substrate-binding protein